LGTSKIELADIEPFQMSERVLNLASKLGEKGSIKVRLVFQPEIIVKSRKNTSTFSAAGRAMTTIGGLPVGAGKGVLHSVKDVFHRDHAKGNGNGDAPPVPNLPSGQASQPIGQSENMGATAAAFPSLNSNKDTTNDAERMEPGTLRVTVLGAKDLPTGDIKPYVTLRLGDKEHRTKHQKSHNPEW
jgi:hypothetical protein